MIMPESVLMTMVAAVASVAVALISLISSLFASRSSARSAREIEALKESLHVASSARQIADSELSESLRSLKISMRAVQVMKDEIQLALAGSGGGINPEECSMRVRAAREDLFKAYQENHPNLTQIEAAALHSAKNAVANLGRRPDAAIEVEYRSVREELTELQGILRDGLASRLMERIF
jgi:hypothetical protein